jgi:hypothetical protein
VTESQISRRAFLKLLGSGAIALGLGVVGFRSFLDNRNTVNNKNNINNNAIAQSAGSWDAPISQPLKTSAVHAALIGGGKVFWVMGSGNHEPWAFGPWQHGIWNPDGSFGPTNTLNDDLFCCGVTSLANGNVLLCGGTLEWDSNSLNGTWHGAKCAYEVDFDSGSVGSRTEMAHGRWYPTCVSLPDGKVCVIEGWDEYGCKNRLTEFYDPATKSWQIKLVPGGTETYCVGSCATSYYPEAGQPCYGPGINPTLSLYPRMHLMPSGLIASVGSNVNDRVYDPSTFKWLWTGTTIQRHYGTSVLLPLQNTDTEQGKILVCGGSPGSSEPSMNTAEIAKPSGVGLTRRSVQSMQYARKHITPVILPTGQIVIFGGNLQTNKSPVLYPEMFDPVTERWTVWPAATVPRQYHSVGLLLHDGRVWTAGTTVTQTTKEVRIEIFKPWYISETRPSISGKVTGGSYGGTITIPTPNAANITKVSLVRVSAMTHHYNTDQRLIWLQVDGKTGTSVTVKAPVNSKLAPPGYYLIHVLNSAGVPSVGAFIKIGGSTAPPPPPSYISIYSVAGGGPNTYGKLYSGGLTRGGEFMQRNTTYNSSLIGQPIKRVVLILKKSGNPIGRVSVVIRKSTGIARTFGTIEASRLTTTDQTLTFEAASAYTIAANDRLLVEWAGTGSSTDQVWVKKSVTSTSGGFDGQNTKWSHYTTTYTSQNSVDLAGEWFKLA